MSNGFIIVNYNDAETTSLLLEQIKEYKILDLIVIVDNCSKDDSLYNLEKYANDKIHIISNIENKGYGSGINVGAKFLERQLGNCNIIVSNADIVIENESVIIQLIENKTSDMGIIAPCIREHDGVSRGWKIPSPLQDVLLNILYIHRYLRPILVHYKETHYANRIVEVEAVSGCFFLIDSVALSECGYFDENIFLYYEENVISKKLQKIHKKVFISRDSEVFHNHSVSIDKSINHIGKYKELKNSQLYFQKEYNEAGIFSLCVLMVSIKITGFLLKVIENRK